MLSISVTVMFWNIYTIIGRPCQVRLNVLYIWIHCCHFSGSPSCRSSHLPRLWGRGTNTENTLFGWQGNGIWLKLFKIVLVFRGQKTIPTSMSCDFLSLLLPVQCSDSTLMEIQHDLSAWYLPWTKNCCYRDYNQRIVYMWVLLSTEL